jgi:hypothetical protein
LLVTASQGIYLRVGAMKTKTTAALLVLAAAMAAGYALRSNSRADAAAGNCYADSQGPSEPTICN